MPLAVVEGDVSQGHCWSPTEAVATTNTKVRIEGKAVIVAGDSYVPHSPGCTDPPSTHSVPVIQGSPTVFIEGSPVLRDADPLGCGDVADTQIQTSVFVNGGGNAAEIDPTAPPEETIGYTVASISVTYPSILVEGKSRSLNPGATPGSREYALRSWCPTSPTNSNGFVVVLEEEGSGRTFQSFQGVGAPNLPAAAGEIFKQPLDPQVSFELVRGGQLFSINSSTGQLTFNPTSYSPGTSPTPSWTKRPLVKVRVTYGSFISAETTINVVVRMSLTAC